MATSPTGLGNTVVLPCPSLPDDVIMDIFARLPAKFVGRCRYLSRAWAAMLSSEDFADRHRRLANHRHSPRVFFLHHSSRDGPLMHVWSPQDSPNGAPLTLYVPKADNAKRALHIATLVCRGLAIFQTPCTEINYLCNPLTGQMAALPEREKMPWYWDDVLGRHYTSLGLGYDAHMKKHEVVCVYYGGARCDSEGLPRFAGCDLYVVNSNGRWPIQGKPPAWVSNTAGDEVGD
ncbi:F-box protein At1g53790-like [Aegilops tauschii subsp. strangulata]|uniref:F-box protein At1g53790-like n=1 Tax=Aegilops tauschii subsp. strangulata TaxID=200361 RepID=UPI001ABBF7DC|nr:F-box protein At1g53790-like [Aegilops tauschii subsp. strangulata]